MRFSDQVVMVTGAARGIGAAIARAFAAEGAAVVVSDVLDGSPVVGEIREMGRRAVFVQADVTEPTQVQAVVEAAVREFGQLDICVAVAAYSDRGNFMEVPMEALHRTVDVTMWGAFNALRAAARRMVEQGGGGSIVLISSPHAVIPVPGCIAYNMAKAAVDQMARTAAAELLEHQVRVNIVHPGWTDTPGERKYYSDEEISIQGARLPCKRLARPEEIARGVLFLASAESEYINGSTLSIDGGLRLQSGAGRRSAEGKFVD